MKYGVSIKWLAVASFEMKLGKKTVVTDPYITECVGTDLDYTAVENCDFITLTHAHWDHITDIPKLAEKFRPRILCGDQTAMPLAQWLNAPASTIYPMYPDTELDFDDVKIKALYGRHTKTSDAGFNDVCALLATRDICIADPGINALQPIGSMEYRNFLFTLPNGTKVLLWGNDPTVEQLNICKALQPDIVAVVAYGRILPQRVLDIPTKGCINIHASVLPAYRGSAPYQWAVLDGCKESGVSAMYLCREMDAGDVIDAAKTALNNKMFFFLKLLNLPL